MYHQSMCQTWRIQVWNIALLISREESNSQNSTCWDLTDRLELGPRRQTRAGTSQTDWSFAIYLPAPSEWDEAAGKLGPRKGSVSRRGPRPAAPPAHWPPLTCTSYSEYLGDDSIRMSGRNFSASVSSTSWVVAVLDTRMHFVAKFPAALSWK